MFPIDPTIKFKNKHEKNSVLGNRFRDYPQIFKTPEDIEAFINERQLNFPFISNLLKLRNEKDNKLGLTPTEKIFYFDKFFEYIYEVYRVPCEETAQRVIEWLEHLEGEIVLKGMRGIIEDSYDGIREFYLARLRIRESLKKLGASKEEGLINFHENVKCRYPKHYVDEKALEQFWIKSDSSAGQPELVDDEAYMRVSVYEDRVYIFGCDDMSYTFFSEDKEKSLEFAHYLKTAAPVWNFSFFKLIHPELEFTN